MPDTYTELDEFDDPTGLRWQQPPPGPHKPPLPRKDDLDVLAALHELRFLLASQIGRRFMAGRALRSVQHRLNQMFRVGWVRRCEITTRRRGHNQRVYALDEIGYELLQANRGRTELARHVDPDAKWRAPEVADPRLVLHDLHANAWLFALEDLLAPNVLRGWRGPRAARLDRSRARSSAASGSRSRPTACRSAPASTSPTSSSTSSSRSGPTSPSSSTSRSVISGVGSSCWSSSTAPAARRPTTRSSAATTPSSTAGRMALPRYKALGEPPVVVFVVEDEDKARKLLKAADRIMTGRIGKWGVPEAAWPAYGRRRMFVVAERDIHQGTFRAQRLPEHPPALRKALSGRRADALLPEQVASLLPPAFLRRQHLPRPIR